MGFVWLEHSWLMLAEAIDMQQVLVLSLFQSSWFRFLILLLFFLLFGTAEERCEERLCTWHADMTNGWIFWKLPKSLLQSLFFCLLFSFCYVFFCRYCCCCFRLVWKCRRVIRRKSLTCRRRWRCHRQNATRALYVCVAQGGRLPTPSDPFPRCWFVATRRFCATGTIGDHNRLESMQREYYDLWAFRFLKFCCFQLCW